MTTWNNQIQSFMENVNARRWIFLSVSELNASLSLKLLRGSSATLYKLIYLSLSQSCLANGNFCLKVMFSFPLWLLKVSNSNFSSLQNCRHFPAFMNCSYFCHQVEQEVTELMMKALRLCESSSSASMWYLKPQTAKQLNHRMFSIHHRLASLYHNSYRNQVRDVNFHLEL